MAEIWNVEGLCPRLGQRLFIVSEKSKDSIGFSKIRNLLKQSISLGINFRTKLLLKAETEIRTISRDWLQTEIYADEAEGKT